MVVSGFHFVYGFELTNRACSQLELAGIINKQYECGDGQPYYEWCSCLSENIAIVRTPHECRWTDYKGGVNYIGFTDSYGFGQHYAYPFLKLKKTDITKIPFNKLFTDEKFKDDKRTFTSLIGNIVCYYEIIPDDCNCCS